MIFCNNPVKERYFLVGGEFSENNDLEDGVSECWFLDVLKNADLRIQFKKANLRNSDRDCGGGVVREQ